MKTTRSYRSMKRRRLPRWLSVALQLTLAFLAVVAYFRFAPANYNLGEPLDLNDRPTFVTNWKLQLTTTRSCYRALEDAGIVFERLPDQTMDRGCEFEDVARLNLSFIPWGEGITLRCPMLAGLALWEKHTLQPAAEKYFDSKVVRVRHFGTYSCRNINNRPRGRRSQHATANAVDVAGFVLANGEEISIARDWGQRNAKSKFLRQIHDQACNRFNTVLGPDYNALHHDHFHFDNGGGDACR